ncbi:MAG: class I SAM-dependent methyltransferase [Pseudomonadales bacterium]|nr:class I SAM-dependent methyltransferase [Pseudomonadales bacterium]
MPRFRLTQTAAGCQLEEQLSRQKPLLIDFNSGPLQHRRLHGGRKELLLKAVAARPGRHVVDCTAGLGVDAFLMAANGCTVTLLERSPVLALLLADALRRGQQDPQIAAVIGRMALVQVEACSWLAALQEPTDSIYIDQMFPQPQKSAAVKGGMQLLQKFLGHDGEVSGLLQAALATNSQRVIVKRPLVGGETPGLVPDYQLKARASRFDIYVRGGKAAQALGSI